MDISGDPQFTLHQPGVAFPFLNWAQPRQPNPATSTSKHAKLSTKPKSASIKSSNPSFQLRFTSSISWSLSRCAKSKHCNNNQPVMGWPFDSPVIFSSQYWQHQQQFLQSTRHEWRQGNSQRLFSSRSRPLFHSTNPFVSPAVEKTAEQSPVVRSQWLHLPNHPRSGRCWRRDRDFRSRDVWRHVYRKPGRRYFSP